MKYLDCVYIEWFALNYIEDEEQCYTILEKAKTQYSCEIYQFYDFC